MEDTLFPLPEAETSEGKPIGQGTPRVSRPNRAQIEWRPVALDSLLGEDHEARLIWAWVMGLDLSPLYGSIQAVTGEAGRSAIDPAILLALWLYATLKGVGSARELNRLCEEHVAYQWLCGGVSVNYHTLADFRVDQEAYLDQLLVQSIAALTAEGLVKLERVTQDGKKIRASAGSSSFHRQQTLEKHVSAQEQVTRLRRKLAGRTRPRSASRLRKSERPESAWSVWRQPSANWSGWKNELSKPGGPKRIARRAKNAAHRRLILKRG
jgi:transposase